MKKENLQNAVREVLNQFNIVYHPNNPLGNIHSAIEKKAEEFGFKVDLNYPIQHIGYGETIRRNFEVTNKDEDTVLNINTSTYRNDKTGNYEVTSYTSKPEKKRTLKP